MILFALISGLINLSSQVVYQKVVSMVVGDLYTTFISVMLTFILGSALGSYFGNHFRRYLYLIELGAGLFSLGVYALLHGPFYEQAIPLPLVIAALFLPALALGTHIPLYSYYLRKAKFGFVYCLYHFGALFGLLGFEWYFVNAGSVQSSVLFIAITQIILGSVIAILTKKEIFKVERGPSHPPALSKFVQDRFVTIASILTASLLSFYLVLWALKTQVLVNEAYRLHATSVSLAVFLWMAAAGIVGSKLKSLPTWICFAGMSAAALFIQGTFPKFIIGITTLNNGQITSYFFVSLLLSLYLTIPVFFSSLLFVTRTQDIQKHYEVDVASGTLNLFASFGNIAGFAVAGLMASYFWTREYFIVLIGLALICALVWAWLEKQSKFATITSVAILVLAIPAFQTNQKEGLFLNRIQPEFRSCEKITDVQVFSSPLSSVALYSRSVREELADCKTMGLPVRRIYLIDGHLSHDIWMGDEFLVGLSTAKYFDRPLEKSLVIGVGSGQAAWGVAAISKETDMVEIAPVAIDNLAILKDLNGDLQNKPGVNFILQDGFGFARACPKNSYDLIFNTATYPSSFNASKLYSDEFVGFAKSCLTADGVYQTYFDQNTVKDMATLQEFLAPIQKHFRYVDIMLEPYPQVYAYDNPRAITPLAKEDFVNPADYDYFYKLHAKDFDLKCRPFLRNLPRPQKVPRLNTLDRAILEQNGIRRAVELRYGHEVYPQMVNEFYRSPEGAAVEPECL
ncbi:hypothetical protein [Bdellovibrio sp. HCB2-146]|uniref:spermine/spermidine synthase domain-containing protein n=1 Tax=Bdellovibrio sp. HCB2-146 TaxID=3394362 RepID=UPI0039BCF5AE